MGNKAVQLNAQDKDAIAAESKKNKYCVPTY